MRPRRTLLIACVLAAAAGVAAADEPRTVIGPSNLPLVDGAAALMAGNAEKGVRLTLLGLERSTNDRDRIAALSNLCAGFVLLEKLDDALSYCNQAIDEKADNWRALSNRALVHLLRGEFDQAAADVDRAESIAPRALPLRRVKTMLQNAVDPLTPTVIIDDRRRAPDLARQD